MKLSWPALLLFFHLPWIALAETQHPPFNNSQAALQQSLSAVLQMPACALLCMKAVVAQSPCGPVDLACSCNNNTMTEQATACIQQSCTVPEMLKAKNATEVACQRPPRDRSDIVAIAGVAGCIIGGMAYTVRIMSKVHISFWGPTPGFFNDLWWDDAAITLAMMFIVSLSAISVPISKPTGLGHDIWTLTPDQITWFLKLLWHDEYLYVGGLAWVKVSLLCTYLRFFAQYKQFKMLAYIAIGLNIAYFLAFGLASIFQCSPLSLSWTRWEFPEEGMKKCLDFSALGWTSAAGNVLLDVLVIGMPMPLLYKMNLNFRKKALVMLMFGLGFFVTIISILRLRSMFAYGKSTNPTWDYTSMGYWSTTELHCAVLCASLPALRNFARRYFPGLMGVTTVGASGAVSTGLSGATVIGKPEPAPPVLMRPRSDDEEDFIPLQEVKAPSVHEIPVSEKH